jgi:hypothetical protein
MKKNCFITLVVALILFTTACSHKEKTRDERIEDFRSELTAEDSTTMLRLADNAMEQLKAKNIDAVIASLFEYDDSTKEV